MLDGKWNPLKMGRNGPRISHLIFVDDLLLCGQADYEQMQCLKELLQLFRDMSDQLVSGEKTLSNPYLFL